MDATQIRTGAPVAFLKAADGSDIPGRIGGYLVTWGSEDQRDLYGEFFTPETYLGLDWPLPVRPLLYHHGLDETLKVRPVIGAIDTLKADEIGLWAEAQLDMAHEYVEQIKQLIQMGVEGFSSGTLPHLLSVDANGFIRRWPIIEGSLTVTPAEPRHFGGIGLLKALEWGQSGWKRLLVQGADVHLSDLDGVRTAFKSLQLAIPDALKAAGVIEDAAEEEPSGQQDAGDCDECNERNDKVLETQQEEQDMSNGTGTPVPMDALRQAVSDVLAQERQEQALKAQAERAAAADRLEQENATLKAQLEAAQQVQQAPAVRLPGRAQQAGPDTARGGVGRISVRSIFDDADAVDMLHGYVMLSSQKAFRGVSEEYARALADKVVKAGLTDIKSDELMQSTLSGYGDEWVPDLWSQELWRKARVNNVIAPLFRIVEMPSNPYELPVEGSDPTVYYVAETGDEADLTLAGSGAAIPDSKIGSGKVTLTAKKLALRTGFSAELAEDSLVPVLSMYREQAQKAMAAAIDSVLLNGDTETGSTGNINSDDGAPTANTSYLAFDGLRKLGLVTTTANGIDAGGTPTLALMRAARFTMAYQYAGDPSNLAWLVDAGTYAKLLGLPEFITMDKAGAQATNMTGQIGIADGSPVLVTAAMPLTMADGKVNSSANTKGQAVCVYRPGWVVGYRRRVVADVSYLPYFDAYQMTLTVRLALTRIDADVASVLYDITI